MGQWSHLYTTPEWRKARKAFLSQHPVCAWCEKHGRVSAAKVVDHIEPHRGDMRKFWMRENWQPLCFHCHDSHKQRHDKTLMGCDEQGNPLRPTLHWR